MAVPVKIAKIKHQIKTGLIIKIPSRRLKLSPKSFDWAMLGECCSRWFSLRLKKTDYISIKYKINQISPVNSSHAITGRILQGLAKG